MKALVLEAFYGGSHRAFIDGWMAHSRHDLSLLTLPDRNWKWRMRHASLSFAEEIQARVSSGESWELLWCSSMVNLPELIGMCPASIAALPRAIYFHENQLTYPVRHARERDDHFAYTNILSAMAADLVQFNSAYHRDDFLNAARNFLKRMPDHAHLEVLDELETHCVVAHPGIATEPMIRERGLGPLRILWAARWEHDKNPEDFFDAIEKLKTHTADFELYVVGQSYREVPEIFSQAKSRLSEHIRVWGEQSREDYLKLLQSCDVIVSTARHEFFGIGVAEACLAGVYPLLPKRLAYPELLSDVEGSDDHYYEVETELVDKLHSLVKRKSTGDLWSGEAERCIKACRRYAWEEASKLLDKQLLKLVH